LLLLLLTQACSPLSQARRPAALLVAAGYEA
jgi:hypothetical protein